MKFVYPTLLPNGGAPTAGRRGPYDDARKGMMADNSSLRVVGLVLAAVTAAVILVAGWVVSAHVTGALALESPRAVTEMSAKSARR